jgi:signal peptidase
MTYAKVATYAVAGVAGVVLAISLALLLVPRLLHWDSVIILTGSMEPALQAGGIAYVASVDPLTLEVDDMVTFHRDDGSIVTHRIVARQAGEGGVRYQTMGDANASPDRDLVAPAAIEGKVVASLPYVGRWSQWLQGHANFRALIWPIAALIVLNELWSIAGHLRRRDAGPNVGARGEWQTSRFIEALRAALRRVTVRIRLQAYRARLRLAKIRKPVDAPGRAPS